MSRFRPSPTAEAALRSVRGIDDTDVEWGHDDGSALADWLVRQRVGTVRVVGGAFFVDAETPSLLTQIDKHPLVRNTVSTLDSAARLDVALLRLGGIRLGRPISQAVGVAIREWIPHALGVGYRSRFVTDEPCWAIWQSTRVEVESVPLSPTNPHHVDAVRAVAATFEISLPPNW